MQASPFEPGSEITRYYEMLPEGPLANEYREMLAAGDARERARGKSGCAVRAVPGSIDVNIMAKGDRDIYRDGEKLPPRFSDASAALRGFAQSDADLVDRLLGRHESSSVRLRRRVSRLLPGRTWPAQERRSC